MSYKTKQNKYESTLNPFKKEYKRIIPPHILFISFLFRNTIHNNTHIFSIYNINMYVHIRNCRSSFLNMDSLPCDHPSTRNTTQRKTKYLNRIEQHQTTPNWFEMKTSMNIEHMDVTIQHVMPYTRREKLKGKY